MSAYSPSSPSSPSSSSTSSTGAGALAGRDSSYDRSRYESGGGGGTTTSTMKPGTVTGSSSGITAGQSSGGMRTRSPEHETGQHKEGRVATAIERQTAKVPSDTFLWAAGASILGALTLQMMGRKDDAQFIGQWAPTLLCLGIYNKIVKVLGHDNAH